MSPIDGDWLIIKEEVVVSHWIHSILHLSAHLSLSQLV